MKKQLGFLAIMFLFVISCSIEGIQDPVIIVGPPGADGIDGVDGKDGVSSTIEVITDEGGYWLVFFEDSVEVKRIFIRDGVDGVNGDDGISSTIEVIVEEDGYWLVFFENDVEVKRIFVRDGIDGEDGEDGEDGKDGYNSRMNFIDITSEMESDCEKGIRVEHGLDTNRNDKLDPDEVTGFTDICECVCECEYDIPYYDIEFICCDDYEGKTQVVCQVTGIKVTKGIVGMPELETTEIICF